ncbi:MAG: ribonuclease P protein component [Prevotella sp.]
MPETTAPKFGKKERIVSRTLMDKLFGGGSSRSMSAFPLRIVYMTMERGIHDEPVQVLISVSKRHFKRAVKRNRVKRQIREAYRTNKHLLAEALLPTPERALALAFIWQADNLFDSKEVAQAAKSLMQRLADRMYKETGK